MEINKLGKISHEECEDITGKSTQPPPRHRPPDAVLTWIKDVKIALAMDEARKSGHTYEQAVAKAAEEYPASVSTVKRAYARYIREPDDLNAAEKRRKWQKKAG